MSNLSRVVILLGVSFCLTMVSASAQTQVPPCPGYNINKNSNLACEVPTALQTGTGPTIQNSLNSLSPTLATQLSQLPNATAISGTGLTYGKFGFATGSTESLGTILTQRGETIGYHKWYISLSYQRFDFSSIDGLNLKHIPTVLETRSASGATLVDTIADNRVDLRVDQFVALGSFGFTKWLDLTVAVPFSKVTLKTGSAVSELALGAPPGGAQPLPLQFNPPQTTFLAGSANGVGDISAGLKVNVHDGERTKIAIGGEVRFPTGDEANYLGSGAYGVKPYVVFSRAGKKFTPNVNLGYQWNGKSVLSVDPNSGAVQNLPSSFLYSGGVDYRTTSWLTLVGEFVGQAVINGPRLVPTTQSVPGGNPAASVANGSGTYAMDNVGIGFKVRPYKGWLITGSTLFALDEGGLRSKVVPLVGISYRH